MYISLISTLLDKAFLYLDPVSQGAILQAVLGALLAITLFVRAFWSKIKAFYLRLTGNSTPDQEAPKEDSITESN
jgi:hypothetical protein